MLLLAFFCYYEYTFPFFQSIVSDISSPSNLQQHILSADVAGLSFSAPW